VHYGDIRNAEQAGNKAWRGRCVREKHFDRRSNWH